MNAKTKVTQRRKPAPSRVTNDPPDADAPNLTNAPIEQDDPDLGMVKVMPYYWSKWDCDEWEQTGKLPEEERVAKLKQLKEALKAGTINWSQCNDACKIPGTTAGEEPPPNIEE